MIHVIAAIELSSGRRNDFLERFRAVVPKVRAEKGCLDYGPAADLPTSIDVQAPVRENVVTVIERWESVQALEDHLAAPHMLAYRESVKDMVIQTTIHILQPA